MNAFGVVGVSAMLEQVLLGWVPLLVQGTPFVGLLRCACIRAPSRAPSVLALTPNAGAVGRGMHTVSVQGHKAVAAELYELLAPRLKVVEFQALSDVLAGGLNAAKGVREEEAQAVSADPARSPAVKLLRVAVVIAAACLGLAVVLW